MLLGLWQPAFAAALASAEKGPANAGTSRRSLPNHWGVLKSLGRATIACQSQGAVWRSSGPGGGWSGQRYRMSPAIRRLSGRGPRLAGRGPGLLACADSGEGLAILAWWPRNPFWQEALTMEPAPGRPRHEAVEYDDLLVHDWRVAQLARLGIPWSLAQVVAADHVDWHQVAKLVRRGCPPRLALQIVR
jgi:hypothetical protein